MIERPGGAQEISLLNMRKRLREMVVHDPTNFRQTPMDYAGLSLIYVRQLLDPEVANVSTRERQRMLDSGNFLNFRSSSEFDACRGQVERVINNLNLDPDPSEVAGR
jgi:hypothetical protein